MNHHDSGKNVLRMLVGNRTGFMAACAVIALQMTSDVLKPTKGMKLPQTFLGNKMPTSLDSMSPKNPVLLTLADIPTSPGVKAHSIIAIDGEENPPKGGDGVVKYTSAHVDYVESELIVRSYHSCQDKPPTIEELRRILHEHLKSVP
jgi:hypothetical protein